ncbi:hypothetical protein [Glutamicibacter sp. PS]|uniref:hypothetical protein n=1 Tax=Glutamicibacter sp. PS TaxID=3075634 RepID=UPI0028514815|nr:hypothetical protein [Glutamicibacter sp. PS]MDR4533214.1 hypothetical protein [Glutamicibacter sp. PS]
MSLDFTELKTLERDLGRIPAETVSKIKPIINKGALNIKTEMQKDLRASRSFRAVARSVDYDTFGSSGFGATSYSVEIGPNKSRDPAAALAGIAYFGGAHGGGGSVRDPAEILAAEADVIESFIEKAIQGVL